MNPNEYLQAILKNQTLKPGSKELDELEAQRKNVQGLLEKKYGSSSPSICYAGSKMKGTMNRADYDLDIAAYFHHDDTTPGETLQEIFDDVKGCLQAEYLVVPKTSALRLKSLDGKFDFHIDVVPGRFVHGKEGDVFLYQYGVPQHRLQTNLEVHRQHISKSGRIDEIRLVKLWKGKWTLKLKTFALELLVIKLLKGSDIQNLSDRLVNLWEQISEHPDQLSVEDPANSSNDLSGELNSAKPALVNAASQTLLAIEKHGWESVYGPAGGEGDGDAVAAIQAVIASRPKPPKLWLA
jgi:hypothetical protein